MSEPKSSQGLSRRRFLIQVGKVGGAAALYEAMTAMGLINVPQAWAGPLKFPENIGNGKTVVILGAGVGGLTTAYELSKIGYDCTILEAQNRVGGRNHTIRSGDVITEQSQEHGVTEQVCHFEDDPEIYLNAGPGRIPYHHRRLIHYCNILSVELENYVMNTTANLFQSDRSFGAEPQSYRQIKNDTQGYIAEMLAKCVDKGALDEELDLDERQALLSLLKKWGMLGKGKDCFKYEYYGSTNSGCRYPPSVYQQCEPPPPIPFSDLLQSRFWNNRFYQPDQYEWQPTLFQPKYGMDMIIKGFERALQDKVSIQISSPVTEINVLVNSVLVQYDSHEGPQTIEADYVISSIPLPILSKISNNFTPDFSEAVDQARLAPTCKVGWQSYERFWEGQKYQIYGGISWIDNIITQVWYPSNNYFADIGVLTGLYNFGQRAIDFGRMSLQERLLVAKSGIRKLQPEFGIESIVPTDLGLSIAWQNVHFQQGGWVNWDPISAADAAAYERLLQPEVGNRFYVVGDQVSSLPGWQEGAIMSAEHVVESIAGFKRRKRIQPIIQAPDSRSITGSD
ncbi:MAG: NAD(P)-binding protein [Gammaproteobacteria bacterium]|nr:NAD(P)-binding protein [Candidatus Neomarinimicrobiota bacterium]MBT5827099.1 NAD(P)-binding protein [Gammaproteobacteria bacterium]MBT6419302.1 NAD(P)-binding protein [Gammaproteobacteria bacterium]MBT7436171.1 NAD(P)-binding protein [Gammaproteobacteria bacterium]